MSYVVLTAAIKRVAREMGLDPQRYHTHSLRIGVASMLAAAQVPDYMIQKLGRWKSVAFLEYIRLSKRSFEAALTAVSNPTVLTANDIRATHAGIDLSGRVTGVAGL